MTTVLPHTIDQFRGLLRQFAGKNVHELAFLAHQKGCEPLEMLFFRYPEWNNYQEDDTSSSSGSWNIISPTQVRFTPHWMQKELQEEIFELSPWMQTFLRIFKGFTFIEDPKEWATETTYSWDDGWGEMRASGVIDVNIGFFKYNRVSWIDCLAILDWIERDEEPMMFPSPFITKRLLPRNRPHKLFIDRNAIRIYPVQIAKYDRGVMGGRDLKPFSKRFYEGAEYSSAPLAETDSLPADFEVKSVTMGTRVEVDVPGVETVFSYLWTAAMGEMTFCYYTYWPSQGIILLEYPPEKVAELLRMELSEPTSFPQRRRVPLIEESLHPFERLLLTEENGRLAHWHFQAEWEKTLYRLDFDKRVSLSLEERGTMHWIHQSGKGASGEWLSECFETALERGLLPGTIEEFAALDWRTVKSATELPPRFATPLTIILDGGDEIWVREEITGYEYIAKPINSETPNWAIKAPIQGKEGMFTLTYIEAK